MKYSIRKINVKIKGLSINNRRPFVLLFFSIVVLGIALVTFFDTKAYKDAKMIQPKLIVIDAGHGGSDPGKVSRDGICEKDINLAIAKKLEIALVNKGFTVVMLRDKDEDLASFGATNKKKSDMNNRVEKINSLSAACLISIHQNSFPDSSVKGLQVFYYGKSDSGKSLACSIQTIVRETIDVDNNRQIKEGNDYFILRKSNCPGVIVECGFLSNPEEALKLTDQKYQEKIAEAIAKACEEEFQDKEQSGQAHFISPTPHS